MGTPAGLPDCLGLPVPTSWCAFPPFCYLLWEFRSCGTDSARRSCQSSMDRRREGGGRAPPGVGGLHRRGPALCYFESFNFLGRSANITAIVPYARGNFSADIEGVSTHAYRSGMADARVRDRKSTRLNSSH